MHQKEYVELGITTFTEKVRAVIKIQDGCDRFCSYCIIPYARGRVRSRQKLEILEEITKIAEKGIKEVVLTGIHIVDKIDGIERIRLRFIRTQINNRRIYRKIIKIKTYLSAFSFITSKRMHRSFKKNE